MSYRKYHNEPTYIGDKYFDSKAEARRYTELCLLQKAGKISNLERQKKFLLIPTQRSEGKTERSCYYIADFTYMEDGKLVVEDCKGGTGCRTPEYRLKRKMMIWFYKIWIRET